VIVAPSVLGVAMVVALALATPVAAHAQEEEQVEEIAPVDRLPTYLRGMEERVSLDLRNTEAADALKYLATKGGLNIAISKNVSGRVNLFLTDVPIRDVFDLILRSNDLAYDTQGNIYNIMTEGEYRALYGKRFADLRRVERRMRPKFLDAYLRRPLEHDLRSAMPRVNEKTDAAHRSLVDALRCYEKLEPLLK